MPIHSVAARLITPDRAQVDSGAMNCAATALRRHSIAPPQHCTVT
ncbi:MAG: hypothetical protein WCD86_22755 [Ktedonobacteraceae bacterium]